MKKNLTKKRQKVAGFTLLELIISIAIMGILMSFALPNLQGFLQAGRLQTSTQMLLAEAEEAKSEARSKRTMRAVLGERSKNEISTYNCRQAFDLEGNISCDCDTKLTTIALESGVNVDEDFAFGFYPPHGDIFIPDDAQFFFGVGNGAEKCSLGSQNSQNGTKETQIGLQGEGKKAVNLQILATSGLIEIVDANSQN